MDVKQVMVWDIIYTILVYTAFKLISHIIVKHSNTFFSFLYRSTGNSGKKAEEVYLNPVDEQEEGVDEIISIQHINDSEELKELSNNTTRNIEFQQYVKCNAKVNFNLGPDIKNANYSAGTICNEQESLRSKSHFATEKNNDVCNEDSSANLITFTDVMESKESCV